MLNLLDISEIYCLFKDIQLIQFINQQKVVKKMTKSKTLIDNIFFNKINEN